MKSIATTVFIAAAVLAGQAVAAQKPGEPDPADRGGVFTVTGCLGRDAGAAGQPDRFTLTDLSTATGEARVIGAMGVGTPLGTQGDPLRTPHSDPPDIVGDEFIVVPAEGVDLAEHVGKKVEMRGMLADPADEAALAGGSRPMPDGAAPKTEGAVFMAASVDTIAGSCAQQQ